MHSGTGTRDAVLEFRFVEQHARLGVVEDLAQLGWREARVDRQRDRADSRRREDGLEERGAIREHDRDTIAARDARCRSHPAQRALRSSSAR